MTGKDEKSVEEIMQPGRKKAEEIVEKAAEPIKTAAQSTALQLSRFGEFQGSSGVILVAAALVAIVVSNSPLSGLYNGLFDYQLEIRLGPVGLEKAVLLWVNDGLMAVFFFLVGLEIKREFAEGGLRYPSQIALPFCAAAGGMVVPAAMFALLNWGAPDNLQGWAIPMATDIAFALGVIALAGSRVPTELRVFLLSVAIFDDIGAILIIALFYGHGLDPVALGVACSVLVLLVALNLAGVRNVVHYLLLGVVLWVAVLKSGVHATLAGVLVALTVPVEDRDGRSPLKQLEDALDPWVAYAIMPVFAFANAGLSFEAAGPEVMAEPLAGGIIAGLVLGKPLGVLLASAILVGLGGAKLPDNVTWLMLAGVGALAGIGFTMSLFIGTLAFSDPALAAQVRMAVFAASILSAVIGYALIVTAVRRQAS